MKKTAIFLLLFATCVASGQIRHKKLRPKRLAKLEWEIPEGSGLTAWNGKLWTHNDSGDITLYALDTATAKIVAEYELPGTVNTDWEDIAQDDKFFYLGDIGNNLGDRDTLNILKIEKASLLAHKPVIERIYFTWPDKANYDCEALIAAGDSLYVFTKEWKKARRTQCFSIAKWPGNHIAKFKSSINTRVLITGATFDEKLHKLALCGYNLWLRPFMLIFENVNMNDVLNDSYVEVKVKRPFRQIEGIGSFDGKTYYLINEDWKFLFIKTSGSVYKADIKKLK